MMRKRLARTAVILGLTGVAMLATAGSASATFHLIKIRSIFRGPATANAFVELQMYADGQNLVGSHSIRVCPDAAMPPPLLCSAFNLPSNVANGGNQRMILIRDSASMSPSDFPIVGLGAAIDGVGAGGALCWDTVDCVSWGTFNDDAFLPSSAGTPMTGSLSTSMVRVRSIAANCPTALDEADDTNQSNADFGAAVGYVTRTNASTPIETVCPPPLVPTLTPTATPTTPTKKKKCKKKKKRGASAAKKRCKKKKKR